MQLDVDDADHARFARLLSAEEQQRAASFRFDRDRRRYVARHGRLRELLGGRLGCAPQEVALQRDDFGKPFIASSALRFNLSHAGGLALCVIAAGLEIGCDIEWRHPGLASPEVACQFFAPLEVEMLASVPAEAWAEAFFNCWTRKEAFVKGCGRGLSCGLADFDVSLRPGEPAAFLRGAEGWSLAAFEPLPGLHLAVAASSPSSAAWRLVIPRRPNSASNRLGLFTRNP
ncbi:4'-phosphopantetheinyl transferase family protein [Vineibacter terrae]|uniref:4'-phosphopantetheinyl transferase family protein n=1 Tax=Vineibacter terrae TaxID=2586908 RepID=UPI002E2F4F74|nr:4'-phosphopantetheinyl transferase superfamily protein [Vineibacter terrae]HEX2888670.1 4'-phosphopantetheinyl transferase superfamily protein [Vineibacter terrae]